MRGDTVEAANSRSNGHRQRNFAIATLIRWLDRSQNKRSAGREFPVDSFCLVDSPLVAFRSHRWQECLPLFLAGPQRQASGEVLVKHHHGRFSVVTGPTPG